MKKDAERAEKLKLVLQEVGKAIYAQTAQAQPTGEAQATSAGMQGKVLDAEFKETKAS